VGSKLLLCDMVTLSRKPPHPFSLNPQLTPKLALVLGTQIALLGS